MSVNQEGYFATQMWKFEAGESTSPSSRYRATSDAEQGCRDVASPDRVR